MLEDTQWIPVNKNVGFRCDFHGYRMWQCLFNKQSPNNRVINGRISFTYLFHSYIGIRLGTGQLLICDVLLHLCLSLLERFYRQLGYIRLHSELLLPHSFIVCDSSLLMSPATASAAPGVTGPSASETRLTASPEPSLTIAFIESEDERHHAVQFDLFDINSQQWLA